MYMGSNLAFMGICAFLFFCTNQLIHYFQNFRIEKKEPSLLHILDRTLKKRGFDFTLSLTLSILALCFMVMFSRSVYENPNIQEHPLKASMIIVAMTLQILFKI